MIFSVILSIIIRQRLARPLVSKQSITYQNDFTTILISAFKIS